MAGDLQARNKTSLKTFLEFLTYHLKTPSITTKYPFGAKKSIKIYLFFFKATIFFTSSIKVFDICTVGGHNAQ